jgi:broad specificity phosphatase PhoE
MTVLIAVRHGESAANADPAVLTSVLDGRRDDADIPLTPRGREQSVRLGRELLGLDPVERVLSSPYRRCRETVRIAAAEFARAGRALPAVEYEEGLRDRDVVSGERPAEVALRVGKVLGGLDERRVVLFVVHDAIVLTLRQLADGVPSYEPVENASITRLTVANPNFGQGS